MKNSEIENRRVNTEIALWYTKGIVVVADSCVGQAA
jgi:hypothetical protein